jgi:hypothetical protein
LVLLGISFFLHRALSPKEIESGRFNSNSYRVIHFPNGMPVAWRSGR